MRSLRPKSLSAICGREQNVATAGGSAAEDRAGLEVREDGFFDSFGVEPQ